MAAPPTVQRKGMASQDAQGWESDFGEHMAEDLEAIIEQDEVFGGTDGANETGEEDRGES